MKLLKDMEYKMKKLFILLICLTPFSLLLSQGEMGPSELLIKNKLSPDQGNIKVRIYPVGVIFGTGDHWNNTFMRYSAVVGVPKSLLKLIE